LPCLVLELDFASSRSLMRITLLDADEVRWCRLQFPIYFLVWVPFGVVSVGEKRVFLVIGGAGYHRMTIRCFYRLNAIQGRQASVHRLLLHVHFLCVYRL
jgi:hypothetical protein